MARLEQFIQNKNNHRENRKVMLERYIKELEAKLGKKEVRDIIDR